MAADRSEKIDDKAGMTRDTIGAIEDQAMIFPILALTKTIAFLIRAGRVGHGFTWPGEIALRLSNAFVRTMIEKNADLKTVLIVGTNGKTTSAKITRHILRRTGTGSSATRRAPIL